MKKADIAIKIILAIILLPISAIYLAGLTNVSGHSYYWLEQLLIGYALFSVWWGIFKYHDITFKQIPKYIWAGLVMQAYVPISQLFGMMHDHTASTDIWFVAPMMFSPWVVEMIVLLLIKDRTNKLPKWLKNSIIAIAAVMLILVVLTGLLAWLIAASNS